MSRSEFKIQLKASWNLAGASNGALMRLYYYPKHVTNIALTLERTSATIALNNRTRSYLNKSNF
jgi:hypothetical protein